MGKLIFIIGFSLPVISFAHGGKTDAHGCHVKKSTGEYHCHKGPYKGKSYKNKKEGKESIKNNGNKKK